MAARIRAADPRFTPSDPTPKSRSIDCVRTIPVEFGPLTWSTGRAYVHDVDFDQPTDLTEGEVVELAGEDGTTYRAVVAGVEVGNLGRTWTLVLPPGQAHRPCAS